MKEKSVRFRSDSAQQTIELGRRIGLRLQEGDVLGLIGELGTGKTWLTKGIALGLGVESDQVVTSPSFTLVNMYEGRIPIYHLDVYRLSDASEFASAGLDEYFFMGGVALLEWADRWPELLPSNHLKVIISFMDESSRDIVLKGASQRAIEIIEELEASKTEEYRGIEK
ncbi:MAG: tRNA (adenosine(37)-N6)-threonylcarbamoyltransferase complex ATPase subunit type 1 TsaE [Deltaproteobacteria bacterium]|nr:MAG: tRNA (adenosine(37)-N6)-threonylcarbamoyltransferase complex ATPase subunit type 1 TsaE [Deltaproteobacteria bacterium]HDG97463.1 tRNA (adenosine(37)-N6)-threonylcarbamoyltransferase complex ATPase subunit type 1 TsaE [Desulfobacterales bacterium]